MIHSSPSLVKDPPPAVAGLGAEATQVLEEVDSFDMDVD